MVNFFIIPSYIQVWTPRGKTKALIRAAFNERSLERYVLMWLSDPILSSVFEPWSLMLNKESSSLLPSLAAGLSAILFAVAVDTPDINVTKTGIKKTEPVVFAPAPVGPTKKKIAIKRQILTTDDTNNRQGIYEAKDSIVENCSIETLNMTPVEEICGTSSGSVTTTSNEIDDDDNENNGLSVIDQIITTGSEDSAVDVLEHFEISRKRYSITSTNNTNSNLNDESSLQTPSMNVSVTPDISSESSSYFSRQSSLHSSICSTSGKVGLDQMEEKIKDLTEKCIFLEARVAELSL